MAGCRAAPSQCSALHPPVADRKSTRLNSSHTVIYTLSLHDALPICTRLVIASRSSPSFSRMHGRLSGSSVSMFSTTPSRCRSEEHTSELQSHSDLHSFPTRRSSDLHQVGDRFPQLPFVLAYAWQVVGQLRLNVQHYTLPL